MTNVTTRKIDSQWSARALALFVGLILALIATHAKPRAQSFSSGSDGSDGALSLTIPGAYTFAPDDVSTFNRVLDADGDGVYNFTTINIASGVTLRISASHVNRPVYWLASGAVTIAGQIDLSGQGPPFNPPISLDQRRIVSAPGAGGYAGGAGSSPLGLAPIQPAQPGQGPGGGAAAVPSAPQARGGTFSGNRFLVPLVGGSGGGGNMNLCGDGVSSYGNSGGAGGGAIAIVSSLSIAVTGSIRSDGGNGLSACGSVSGSGSGGAIRLAAPIVSGNGVLRVVGGIVVNGQTVSRGGPGQIRVEALQAQYTFNIEPVGQGVLSIATPSNSFIPTSSVRVVRVNGIALPPNPTGSFALPDVTISQRQSVLLEIEAKNIPTGTVVNLEVFSENPTDNSVVNVVVASTPLAGTVDLSTATASFTFPFGFSRCFVRATWTQ